MIYPHTFNHYSILYTKNNGARERTPYLQAANVVCFYQPAPSVNRLPNVQADIEQRRGVVYTEDGATWEDIEIDHLLKIDDRWHVVTGKKNLVGANRVFKLDVLEDISGEFE